MYRTAEWRRLRKLTLAKFPICTRCHSRPSTIVDHIKPHRFDPALFFDPNNLTGLDKQCHDNWKAKKELGHVDTACDDAGYPQDPNHPWLKDF